ncbi:MAG: hypothetical protein ABI597_11685, partial [Gammaproteobacteria bacterium]
MVASRNSDSDESKSTLTLEALKTELNHFKMPEEKSAGESLRAELEKKDSNNVLANIKTILEQEKPEAEINAALAKFLEERWRDNKGTFLSYTSIPTAESTRLCCMVGEYLANNTKEKSALAFLMPTIKYTKDQSGTDNQDLEKMALEQVLRFYITSTDNESLIPIQLLNFLDLSSDESTLNAICINPYVLDTTGKYPHPVKLNDDERRRLIKHSIITEDIVSSLDTYNQILKESGDLYGAIKSLISGLRRGGEHGVEGGTASEANPFSLIAIDEFRLYWHHLTDIRDNKNENAAENRAFEEKEFKEIIDSKILKGERILQEIQKEVDAIKEDDETIKTKMIKEIGARLGKKEKYFVLKCSQKIYMASMKRMKQNSLKLNSMLRKKKI